MNMKLYETLLYYRQKAAASGTGCTPISIEFLNEVDLHIRIAAQEQGEAQHSGSVARELGTANKQSVAITLFKEALIYAETGNMNKWFLLNHERISAVVA